jgi:hypothetical protein
MMADYTDILIPAEDNPSGTKQVVYFAPLSHFDTIAKEGGLSAATLEEVSDITADHTFKTGNNFYKMELEINKNELASEYQGAVRGNHDKFDFTGFAANLSKTQLGLMRKARAEKHIVLVPLNDGKVMQLGEEGNGAMISTSVATGTQEGGERGINVNIAAYHYPKLYSGAISFTPAV